MSYAKSGLATIKAFRYVDKNGDERSRLTRCKHCGMPTVRKHLEGKDKYDLSGNLIEEARNGWVNVHYSYDDGQVCKQERMRLGTWDRKIEEVEARVKSIPKADDVLRKLGLL